MSEAMSQRKHTIAERQLSIGRASRLRVAEGLEYTTVTTPVAGVVTAGLRAFQSYVPLLGNLV